ncbi:hypothetical protein Fleli_1238 [Bernardetia litoralis DSM 6794]|uniref:Uncharacterized protein n=1 Tax=Bernardetia litoralis (strain ATCC 23117 / DSM 6794 / NBRC 15988 / NCIMB 1366 / Fx l1 / Sio-4) TaxID=880071 RepID=I4AI90_BERLS|nr:hypothetical protein Fleli_1238 [Bernardetia litoralis DSM 6794]
MSIEYKGSFIVLLTSFFDSCFNVAYVLVCKKCTVNFSFQKLDIKKALTKL